MKEEGTMAGARACEENGYGVGDVFGADACGSNDTSALACELIGLVARVRVLVWRTLAVLDAAVLLSPIFRPFIMERKVPEDLSGLRCAILAVKQLIYGTFE